MCRILCADSCSVPPLSCTGMFEHGVAGPLPGVRPYIAALALCVSRAVAPPNVVVVYAYSHAVMALPAASLVNCKKQPALG